MTATCWLLPGGGGPFLNAAYNAWAAVSSKPIGTYALGIEEYGLVNWSPCSANSPVPEADRRDDLLPQERPDGISDQAAHGTAATTAAITTGTTPHARWAFIARGGAWPRRLSVGASANIQLSSTTPYPAEYAAGPTNDIGSPADVVAQPGRHGTGRSL